MPPSDLRIVWAGSVDGTIEFDPNTLLPTSITIHSKTYYDFTGDRPMSHWLSHAIATLRREETRWERSDGEKSASHATAAAILEKVAESGATHEEVKEKLLAEPEGPEATLGPRIDYEPRGEPSQSVSPSSNDPADLAPPTA